MRRIRVDEALKLAKTALRRAGLRAELSKTSRLEGKHQGIEITGCSQDTARRAGEAIFDALCAAGHPAWPRYNGANAAVWLT